MKELELQKFLKDYEGKSVDFYRFPGNFGDSLIWHGTKRLLSLSNVTIQLVEILSEKYNDTLFIDGGGNFVDYYSDVRDFLTEKPDLYKEVVILPHTIFGERQIEVLNNISSKLTVFCREKVSAQFAKERLKHGTVYLSQDCAFYNEIPKAPTGKGVLNAFRVDKESTVEKLPEENQDISFKGYATKPLDEFLDTLKKYEEVNTDRLHVAIAAALLGKHVNLYPNSYYKNKAVFDYSLKRFPNVSFIQKYRII